MFQSVDAGQIAYGEHPPTDLWAVQPPDSERIGDVFEYIQVWIQTQPVHDERNASLTHWQSADASPANLDIAAVCRKETRNDL
jgi:hypothetical protein